MCATTNGDIEIINWMELLRLTSQIMPDGKDTYTKMKSTFMMVLILIRK